MRQQRPSQGVSRVELEAGAGAEGRIVQRLAVTASKSALHTSAVARCWETAGRSLCGASQHTNLPKATYRMLGWNSGQGRAAQTRSSVGEFEQAGCRVCRCSRVLALGTEHAPTATETEGRLSTVHPTFPKASCIMTLDVHMQALLAVIFTSTCTLRLRMRGVHSLLVKQASSSSGTVTVTVTVMRLRVDVDHSWRRRACGR